MSVVVEPPRRLGPRRREVTSALELFALCGIAFAQPIFDLLGKNTGIFVTRASTGLDLVLVSLMVLLGPPLALYAVEVVSGLVLPRVRRYVHAVLCGALIGVFAEEILKRSTDLAPVRLVHLGVLSGILGALAVLTQDWARSWLRILAIAPPLFAAVFVFASPASSVIFGGTAKADSAVNPQRPKRIVMVVFDELPLQSLLDGNGAVDEELYPNFATLASESTWYRNTTTVAPYTERAVPAILTGRLPPTGTVVPSAADYPQNLFTLLGGAYPLNVHEAVTGLCPRSLCTARATDATGARRVGLLARDAFHLWRDFASPEPEQINFSEHSVVRYGVPQMWQFLASLRAGNQPQLDFVHVELPHQPWHLLPTLQDTQRLAPQQGASTLVWQSNPWPAESAKRQHLLQVQATDTVLGRITTRLKQLGVWDDSLVVVTADHGVSLTPNEGIRSVTGNNYEEILWTPLFVKYPNQKEPVVDDRPAQTIDVLPTVADVIGAKIPWKIDGVSLRGPARPDFAREFDQTKGSSFAPPSALGPEPGQRYLLLDPAGFADVLKRRAVEAGGDPALRVYRAGPYGDLVGRSVSELPVLPPAPSSLIHVANVRNYDHIDPSARLVPWAFLEGILDNWPEETWVAVALNGRIAGIGQGLPFQDNPNGTLTTVVAPQFAVPGRNDLTVYAISGDPGAPTLRQIPVYRGPGE